MCVCVDREVRTERSEDVQLSFVAHGVNEQSCSLESTFLLELRLTVYHKLLRRALFCYATPRHASSAQWLGYEAAHLACRSVMKAQRSVERMAFLCSSAVVRCSTSMSVARQ